MYKRQVQTITAAKRKNSSKRNGVAGKAKEIELRHQLRVKGAGAKRSCPKKKWLGHHAHIWHRDIASLRIDAGIHTGRVGDQLHLRHHPQAKENARRLKRSRKHWQRRRMGLAAIRTMAMVESLILANLDLVRPRLQLQLWTPRDSPTSHNRGV